MFPFVNPDTLDYLCNYLELIVRNKTSKCLSFELPGLLSRPFNFHNHLGQNKLKTHVVTFFTAQTG